MRKPVRFFSVFAIALFLADAARADVTIGVAGPMTGPRASYGQQMRQAAEIAAAQINAEGGILGQKIILDIQDDANQAPQAVIVANHFVNTGVHFVIGHWGAGMTLPASDIYDKAGILMITPASIVSDITAKNRPLIFRTIGTDRQLADKSAQYLKNAVGPSEPILIITDSSTPTTQSVAQFIEENLQQAGYGNVTEEPYAAGETDFSALVAKVKQLRPLIMYCSCAPAEGSLIIKALRGADVVQPLVGTKLFADPELWRITGPLGDGTVFVSDPDYSADAAAQDFVAALADKQIQPLPYHFYTYASFQVLKQAVVTANSWEPAAVASAMHAGQFDTVLGSISYMPNGDLKDAKYEIFVHRNNKSVLIAQ